MNTLSPIKTLVKTHILSVQKDKDDTKQPETSSSTKVNDIYGSKHDEDVSIQSYDILRRQEAHPHVALSEDALE